MEKVWGVFHRERCSDKYKQLWSGYLLESIRCSDINPTFYRSITDSIFKVMLRQKLPIKERDHHEVQNELLSYELQNELLGYKNKICTYYIDTRKMVPIC